MILLRHCRGRHYFPGFVEEAPRPFHHYNSNPSASLTYSLYLPIPSLPSLLYTYHTHGSILALPFTLSAPNLPTHHPRVPSAVTPRFTATSTTAAASV